MKPETVFLAFEPPAVSLLLKAGMRVGNTMVRHKHQKYLILQRPLTRRGAYDSFL